MRTEDSRSDDSAKQAGGETADSPLDRFLPESLRAGRRRISRHDEEDALPDAGDAPAETPPQLSEVGAHVDLVLGAAEHAAAQIRQEAQEAANEIRLEAGRDAARIRSEAEEALRASERERAEVEQYAGETRAAADAQAEQRRRDADTEAEKLRAKAAREAGRLVVEAEQRGEELEDAARQRAERLGNEADAIEGRLDDLLATLRGLTDQLEKHLAVEVSAATDPGSESLDDALAPTRSASEERGSDTPSRRSRAKSR